MNSKPPNGSAPKPACPHCERPLTWLAQRMHGRFCSSECRSEYNELMTRLAMERLNAALPKRPDGRARCRSPLALATRVESPVSSG